MVMPSGVALAAVQGLYQTLQEKMRCWLNSKRNLTRLKPVGCFGQRNCLSRLVDVVRQLHPILYQQPPAPLAQAREMQWVFDSGWPD